MKKNFRVSNSSGMGVITSRSDISGCISPDFFIGKTLMIYRLAWTGRDGSSPEVKGQGGSGLPVCQFGVHPGKTWVRLGKFLRIAHRL